MRKIAFYAVFLSLAAFALAPGAHADEWNQTTIMRFSQPMEVPGRVLPAGSYVFKLMDSASSRNIVEILNKNQTRLEAVVLAIPAYQEEVRSRAVILFSERPVGSPLAVKAWFYPGKHYGHRCVYSRSEFRAMEAARERAFRSIG